MIFLEDYIRGRRFTWLIAMAAALLAVDVGAADIKPRSIKISYGTAEDHPFGLGVNKFAELVGAKSNGLMKAKGYPAGQLGAEVPSLASAQGGVIEMTDEIAKFRAKVKPVVD